MAGGTPSTEGGSCSGAGLGVPGQRKLPYGPGVWRWLLLRGCTWSVRPPAPEKAQQSFFLAFPSLPFNVFAWSPALDARLALLSLGIVCPDLSYLLHPTFSRWGRQKRHLQPHLQKKSRFFLSLKLFSKI